MTRQYTNQLIQMIEDGMIDAKKVAEACLSYMSEAEVEDLCISEGFIEEEEEEDEDEEEEEDEE
jgi:hypothetical protein